jgi:hypothetical protein
LGCLFSIVELAGLPLIVIGLENHVHTLVIVGLVLVVLLALDSAIVTQCVSFGGRADGVMERAETEAQRASPALDDRARGSACGQSALWP